MKKFTLLSVALTLVIIAAGLFLSSGFEKRTDVHLQDFSLSEDGSVITIKTALSGSMGFIRDMKTETIGRALLLLQRLRRIKQQHRRKKPL